MACVCLWLLGLLPSAAAVRTHQDTVHALDVTDSSDAIASDEASLDLQRRMALNATGLERFVQNVTIHQEEPKMMEEVPTAWKDRLKIVKELGHGAFGRIYKLAVTCDGTKDRFVSLKFSEKEPSAYREVRALRRMKGAKCVLSTVGVPDYVETSDAMYTLTPFMNSGDFHDLWTKCVKTKGCQCSKEGIARTCWDKVGGPYSNAYVLALFYQAVLGVQNIHGKGLVHQDIKPENIMLNCIEDQCSARVIDLGVAREFGALKPAGTPGYLPPEVMKILQGLSTDTSGVCQPENDVFALGVVLYTFLYGKQPPFFSDGKNADYDPTNDAVIPQSDHPEQSELDRLVISMLTNDYKKRIGTPEILQHLMAGVLTLGDDVTPEVIEMFSLKHVESGDEDLPQCLWDWTPPRHDLADGPVHRDDCLEYSSEKMKGPIKGMKICQCPVLRQGKHTVGPWIKPAR